MLLFWVQASLMTYTPIGTIKPVLSAIGMNWFGEIRPSLGRCHLSKASNPRIFPVRESNCGWYTR